MRPPALPVLPEQGQELGTHRQGKVDGELLLVVMEGNLVLITAKHVKKKKIRKFQLEVYIPKGYSYKENIF